MTQVAPTIDTAPATTTCTLTQPKRKTRTKSKPSTINDQGTVRAWIGTAMLFACVLFAAFCGYKHVTTVELPSTLPIEDVRPGYEVIVDAPEEALAADVARLAGRDATWNASDGTLDVDGVVATVAMDS